jgi:hypothetical protein
MSEPISSPPPDERFSSSRTETGHPLPAAPPLSATIAYRPISGFAIAGVAFAGLFALLMLMVVGVAFTQGTPFFFSPWVLLLPAAGLVLSLMARSQIRGSEGTRAGEPLARTGLWISLLTGLGYFVYYYVTGLAVTSQANNFFMEPGQDMGFFPHLQKADSSSTDFNAAFLLSLPPGGRGNVRPDDELAMLRQHDMVGGDGAPGHLSTFRTTPLARIFTNGPAGEKVAVAALGVQGWGFEHGSYFVRRNYRITTPEAIAEFSMLARSSEGEAAGEQRKWYADLKQVPPPAFKLTALGENLVFLRGQSQKAIDLWKSDLSAGKSWKFSGSADATAWGRLMLTELQLAHIKARTKELFEGKEPNGLVTLSVPPPAIPLTDWTMVDGKLRIGHAFKMSLEPRTAEPFMLEGRIVVETKAPFDPRNPTPEPEWVVHSVSIIRAVPMNAKKGPPQPGL